MSVLVPIPSKEYEHSTYIADRPRSRDEEEYISNPEDEDIQAVRTQSRHTTIGKKEFAGGVITKILTTRSCASVRDPGPPPDGGVKAWTQAFMGHLVVFNTWGVITSFGVFQAYYTSQLGMAPSTVSWIGSMQGLCHFLIGAVSGRALDAGYFYHVFVGGLILELLGVFMTSLSTNYWQLFLAQGVCTGIGCGLQFCPAVSLVSTYFDKHRSVAVAIVVSGSATGGMVYPTLVRQLLPKIGFAWCLRAMGLIMIVIGGITCAFMRPRLPPRKSGPLVEIAAFKETPYALYCVGVFLVIWGQLFPFYYVSFLCNHDVSGALRPT